MTNDEARRRFVLLVLAHPDAGLNLARWFRRTTTPSSRGCHRSSTSRRRYRGRCGRVRCSWAGVLTILTVGGLQRWCTNKASMS